MIVRVIVLVIVAAVVVGAGSCAFAGWQVVRTSARVNNIMQGRLASPLPGQNPAEGPADFAVAAASAFVSGPAAGRTMTVAWTVNRQGEAMGAQHTDLLYLCPSPEFASCGAEPIEATVIEGTQSPLLGRSYSRRVTLPLPTVAPGTYYVHLIVDAPYGQASKAVQEGDEGNNRWTTRLIVPAR